MMNSIISEIDPRPFQDSGHASQDSGHASVVHIVRPAGHFNRMKRQNVRRSRIKEENEDGLSCCDRSRLVATASIVCIVLIPHHTYVTTRQTILIFTFDPTPPHIPFHPIGMPSIDCTVQI